MKIAKCKSQNYRQRVETETAPIPVSISVPVSVFLHFSIFDLHFALNTADFSDEPRYYSTHAPHGLGRL